MYGYENPSSPNHPSINRDGAALHCMIQYYIIIIIMQYYVQRI